MIMSKLFSDKLISNILRFKRDQNGSVLVIMAVALVVILGMAALVVDVGALVLEKGRLQNACDAAALAAVRVAYDDSQTNARNEAEKYLDENDADYEVDNVIFNSDKTVTVSASSTVNYAFAKVLGIYSGTVDANATAVYGPVKSITGKKGVIGGVDPIGISEEVVRDEDFEFGKEYTLITADNNDIIGPGNFGFLALGGTGNDVLAKNIEEGCKTEVKSKVDTEPGAAGNKIETALKERKCPHTPSCTPTSFKKDCPSLLTVVILEEGIEYNGRDKAKIVGFATFLLSYIEKNAKSVKGYFIERTVPKNSEFVIDPGGEDFGLVASRLIK